MSRIPQPGAKSGHVVQPQTIASRLASKPRLGKRSLSMADLTCIQTGKKTCSEAAPAASKATRLTRPLAARNVGKLTVGSRATSQPTASSTARAVASQRQHEAAPTVPTSKVPAKKKRPAWDLKGRLEDMEHMMQQDRMEMQKNNERLAMLEQQKAHLEHNVVDKENISRETQLKLSCIQQKYEALEEEKKANERKLQERVHSLECSYESADRERIVLKDDNKRLQVELDTVKLSRSQIMGDYELVKMQLGDVRRKHDTLEDECKEQKLTIVELRAEVEFLNRKLREGETERRKLHNTVQELKGNIRVFCRVRPLLPSEGNGNSMRHIIFGEENSVTILGADPNESIRGKSAQNSDGHPFVFDKVFRPGSSQEEVYEEISQLVQSALDGYNVCVFAYGQTGSGKTYTMQGDIGNYGIIPRTITQIFKTCDNLKCNGWKYILEATFLEIYNEHIRDLLGSGNNMNHEVKMRSKTEVYVPTAKVEVISSEEQIEELLLRSNRQRAVAATKCNEHSSRSHYVFQLRISGENHITGESCLGTLNLVDLAGSERIKESGSVGDRLAEAKNINSSLTSLRKVLMELGQKNDHISYRNSKLTYLLQHSLGGNSKTLMFVNISPKEECCAESVNSLKFAANVNRCHIGTATQRTKGGHNSTVM